MTISKPASNKAIFRATRVLRPYEGMTVSVSFNKGVLVAPTGTAGALNYISDHRADILPALSVLIVLLYNLWAWNKVGRDPPKGTVIPLFHPPKACRRHVLTISIAWAGSVLDGWPLLPA